LGFGLGLVDALNHEAGNHRNTFAEKPLVPIQDKEPTSERLIEEKEEEGMAEEPEEENEDIGNIYENAGTAAEDVTVSTPEDEEGEEEKEETQGNEAGEEEKEETQENDAGDDTEVTTPIEAGEESDEGIIDGTNTTTSEDETEDENDNNAIPSVDEDSIEPEGEESVATNNSTSEEEKSEVGEETDESEKGTEPPTSHNDPFPAPTDTAPTYSYPTPVSEKGTESPGEENDESEKGTEPPTSYNDPFPAPTDTAPTYSYPTPVYIEPTPRPVATPRPVVPYVSADDDPLEESTDEGEDSGEEWKWNTSSVEELEHNKTVIIALSTVFGVMLLFAIFVAYQLLENPEGCCASICRIAVACMCGVLRCVCYPCRAICGCTGQSTRNHMIVPEDGNFTHDLELS